MSGGNSRPGVRVIRHVMPDSPGGVDGAGGEGDGSATKAEDDASYSLRCCLVLRL